MNKTSIFLFYNRRNRGLFLIDTTNGKRAVLTFDFVF